MAYYKYSDSTVSAHEPKDEGRTLARRVYLELHEEIVAGVLQPGHRLVRKAIAKRLGVSPMPITEALYMLEVDGLVESRPLYGSRVRPLTLEDVRNDEVLREAIECQSARSCAENISEADLSRLLTAARQVDRMMGSGSPRSKLGMQKHLEFHRQIAKGSGFAVLAEELERVWFRRYMRLSWIKSTKCRRVPSDWHQQLVQVIASRDFDQAEAKMREHVRYGQEDDRAALEYFLEQTGGREDSDEET